MNAEDQFRCERDCTRLSHDFAWSVDTRDYDGFVALFAADGVFERAGLQSCGHEAIRKFLDARPANRVTRHFCTNVRIDVTGPGTATGTCMALMYQASAAKNAPLPLPVSTPLVAEYLDDYVLTDAGWKFKHRRTTVVFQS